MPHKPLTSRPMAGRRAPSEHPAGTTLIELMVAVAIIGIVAIGVVGTFAVISKSIQFSKSRTLASNLAQEQMQIMKQKLYSRILVTTSTAYDTDFNPSVAYDTGYYPPETILEGGIYFTRYTHVQAADENSGALNYYGAIADTGMKAITVTVTWTQGADKKKVEIKSIASNIDTTMTNAVFVGYVRNAATSANISGALVSIAENVGYSDYSDGSGNYSVNLSPGNYSMFVSAQGYFTQYRTVSIAANQTQTQNFTLTAMSSGTIRGTAWVTDHLVLAQIVGSSDDAGGFTREWVTLYNPTTWTWTINGNYGLKFQRGNGDASPINIAMTFTNDDIQPGGFYLFANTTTVNGVTADAVWNNTTGGANDLNFPYFSTADPNAIASRADGGSEGAGALQLYRISDSVVIDQMGWTRTASGHSAPFFEGTALNEAQGLDDGEQYVRKSSTQGIEALYGPAYDGQNNNIDWLRDNPITINPRGTSTSTQTAISGTPAGGAFVSATDGLSNVATATITGAVPYAEFILTSVATGTWSVYIASAANFLEISSVVVSAAATTFIPNAVSSPTWAVANRNVALLTSEADEGYITGTVRNTGGSAITPAITVSAGGTSATANTSNGTYLLSVPEGTYEIVANLGNTVASYVSASSQNVVVSLGVVTNGVNFTLSQGGKIRGAATRDGINPLPGISVIAVDANGITKAAEVTGSDGRYTLINLSTGIHYVEPVLADGEASTPGISTVTVTAGTTVTAATFTITGATAFITGSVSASGSPIRTGVLIIGSTASYTGAPPNLSVTSLSGTPYFATNSYEDGTYRLEVKGSTSTAFTLKAFYTTFTGATPSISSRAVSGVNITPGQTTSNVNFTW